MVDSTEYVGRYGLYYMDESSWRWMLIHNFLNEGIALRVMEAIYWQYQTYPRFKIFDRSTSKHSIYRTHREGITLDEVYHAPKFNSPRPFEINDDTDNHAAITESYND